MRSIADLDAGDKPEETGAASFLIQGKLPRMGWGFLVFSGSPWRQVSEAPWKCGLNGWRKEGWLEGKAGIKYTKEERGKDRKNE